MIIARLLSPSPLVGFRHHQLYSDLGADTVMESITLFDTDFCEGKGQACDACFRQQSPILRSLRLLPQVYALLTATGSNSKCANLPSGSLLLSYLLPLLP